MLLRALDNVWVSRAGSATFLAGVGLFIARAVSTWSPSTVLIVVLMLTGVVLMAIRHRDWLRSPEREAGPTSASVMVAQHEIAQAKLDTRLSTRSSVRTVAADIVQEDIAEHIASLKGFQRRGLDVANSLTGPEVSPEIVSRAELAMRDWAKDTGESLSTAGHHELALIFAQPIRRGTHRSSSLTAGEISRFVSERVQRLGLLIYELEGDNASSDDHRSNLPRMNAATGQPDLSHARTRAAVEAHQATLAVRRIDKLIDRGELIKRDELDLFEPDEFTRRYEPMKVIAAEVTRATRLAGPPEVNQWLKDVAQLVYETYPEYKDRLVPGALGHGDGIEKIVFCVEQTVSLLKSIRDELRSAESTTGER